MVALKFQVLSDTGCPQLSPKIQATLLQRVALFKFQNREEFEMSNHPMTPSTLLQNSAP